MAALAPAADVLAALMLYVYFGTAGATGGSLTRSGLPVLRLHVYAHQRAGLCAAVRLPLGVVLRAPGRHAGCVEAAQARPARGAVGLQRQRGRAGYGHRARNLQG
eukprot:7665803-Pyramimonas_sp.AAC.1